MMLAMALHKAMWVGRARTLALCVVAVLVATSIGVLLAADPAYAANFVVNRTADTADANLTNARCDVDASQRGNQCTLRAAIQEANDTAGADQIRFNIVSNANVKTISPASELPTITEAVTINGYSQSGASPNTLAQGNDAVLKIQLNGTNAGAERNGLVIEASDSTIRGLVINRFADRGVRIAGSSATGNEVLGNFIGTNAAGSTDLGNGSDGVLIDDAPTNTIGGTTSAARNIISGNGQAGVQIGGSGATGNEVEGNYIGLNANGSEALPNDFYGVLINDAPDNTVGGTDSGARNIISGNDGGGVDIRGSSATGNQVLGNFIGTTVTGNAALGNSGDGVDISDSDDNTIGGTLTAARNIISANVGDGVRIVRSGPTPTATGNEVEGNYIGLNANGSEALPNASDGVRILSGADNTIGGTAAAARNIISGNGDDGVEISGSPATDNQVLGNFVGTDAGGTADRGNTGDGVVITAANNTIGGTTAGARNVISGNGGGGVRIIGSATEGNQVLGNFIGTDASGTADLGNSSDGVEIASSAANNTIGGTTAAARNVISGNQIHGVEISGEEATGNEVQGNFIGTTVNGSGELGNGFDGVVTTNLATSNTIGGTVAGARNIISGNGRFGVFISGSGAFGAPGNEVQGNFIGTTANGSGELGNGDDGVITINASRNLIGGSETGAGNRIAFSETGDGVNIGDGTGNSILSNRIFSNAGLGIDLDNDGVTNNDTDDPDTGPNRLQNFPVIESAIRSTSTARTIISGTLNSNPSQSYTIQCFVAAPDPSGNGEGASLVAQTTATTNASGDDNRFSCVTTIPVKVGQRVTATATRLDTSTNPDTPTDTSEFSQNETVEAGL